MSGEAESRGGFEVGVIKLPVYIKPCLAANSINALRIKRLTSGQIKGGGGGGLKSRGR